MQLACQTGLEGGERAGVGKSATAREICSFATLRCLGADQQACAPEGPFRQPGGLWCDRRLGEEA